MKNYFLNIVVISVTLCGFFSNPAASNAAGSVLINEISWMGTDASASDEWIELYNSSSSEIDLTGWNLYEAGGETLIVALSGKISAGGYYLIERTNDDTIKDILADLSHSFGGSGLNNSGENLVLKNSIGEIIDSVDASSGWQAGDSSSKSTMERKQDGTWQTNDGVTKNGVDASGNPIKGTPKSSNSQGVIPLVENTGQNSTQQGTTGGGSGSGSSSAETKVLKAEAGADVFIEKGYPISFNGLSSIGAEKYKWYLGDGTIKEGAEIVYTYKFPGTYMVTLEVSSGERTSIDQLRVFIFGGRAVINEFFIGNLQNYGQWVEIYNPNNETLDISRWILSNGEKNFIIPEFVVIPRGGFLVFSQEVTGLDFSSSKKLSIKYPTGVIADEVNFDKNVQGFSANRTSEGFFWSKEITPGGMNIVFSSGMGVSDTPNFSQNSVSFKEDKNSRNYVQSSYSFVEDPEPSAEASIVEVSEGFWGELFGSIVFWILAVVVLGLFSGIFYFKLSRR